ncbi:hypothetical protein HY631_02755 [Candidatus Uhrbacteria bacterium]|nr:hypothetical protein [Candidatus Uhrbacteria bacterium]
MEEVLTKPFYVVRVSADAKFVLVAQYAKGTPLKERTYYRCTYADNRFRRCTWEAALQSSSGIASGMGYGELPDAPFDSMKAVRAWRTRARLVAQIASCREIIGFYEGEPRTQAQMRARVKSLEKKLAKLDAQAAAHSPLGS